MTNPAEYITGRTVQEQMDQLISYVDTRAAEVATTAIASDMATLAQAVSDAEAARDTAIATVGDCVKKTPSGVQTIGSYKLVVSQGVDADVNGNLTGNISSSGNSAFSGSVTVPTIATGTNDTKAANGQKVKNELDAYSPMVRTTGAQTVAGTKTFDSLIATDNATVKVSGLATPTTTPSSNQTGSILWSTADGVSIAQLLCLTRSNGNREIVLAVKSTTGTWTNINLMTLTSNNTVTYAWS